MDYKSLELLTLAVSLVVQTLWSDEGVSNGVTLSFGASHGGPPVSNGDDQLFSLMY